MTNKIEIVVNANDGNSRRVVESLKTAFERFKGTVKSSMESVTVAIREVDRATEKLGRDARLTGEKINSANRQIGSSSSHVSRMGSAMDGARSKAAALGSAVKAAALGIITALAAAAVAVAGFGIKAAASNQTAAISFELLLGGAQKAKAFLDKLKAFAAATPFDLPTLKDAASRLLAVGVNAKDVIPIMTRLGDATAGMGTGAEGIQRAVYALQQMRQAGKVSLEDINQLTDAGIPALDALAAHFKTTVAEIRKRISAGQITADDMFGAIQRGEGPAFQRLKGMMEKQSASLSGVWSTFKDNTQQALADAFAPAIPGLTKMVDSAGQAIPKIIGWFTGIGSRIRDIFKGTGLDKDLKKIFGDLKPEFMTNLKHSTDGLINSIKDNKNEIKLVVEMIAQFIKTVIAWSPKVLGFFSALIQIIGFVVRVVEKLTPFFLELFSAIAHGLATASAGIPGLGDKLRKQADEFDKFKEKVLAGLKKMNETDVNINVKYSIDPGKGKSGTGGGKVSGGGGKTRQYASGGYAPSIDDFWVGEDGPELMNRRTGRVTSHAQSMARASGNGGRDQAEVRTVHWGPGIDSAFASFFMKLVRNGQIKIA